MHLAYMDESGDSGLINSPTDFFVLACVLIHESRWLDTLDLLINLRRSLSQNYGIKARPELKAEHLKGGWGPLRHLSWSHSRRMHLYKDLMLYQAQGLDIKNFAIAIEKRPASARGWRDMREAAWTFAFQRINKFCGSTDWAMIFPDAGHGYFIRRLLRKMRRYHVIPGHWGVKTIPFPTDRIVEDPNDRHSQDSYFIQLADWNAFAAHRSSYIAPTAKIPTNLWDQLGPTILTQVNALRGGPPGIVRYP